MTPAPPAAETPEPIKVVGAPAPQRHLLLRPSFWLRLGGMALVAALLWFTLRGLEWQKLGAALQHVRPLPVLLAAGVNFLHHVCKGVYWRTLLLPVRRLSLGRLFRYSVAQSVGSVLAPARAGEALRVWMLKKHWDLPVPVTGAVAALEKVGDLGALLVLLVPLPWLWPARPWWVDRALLALFAGAVAVVAALYFARRSEALRARPLFAGLQLLHRPGPIALAFSGLVGAWLMDLAVIWLVIWALGVPAPLHAGIVILLTVNLAIAIPAAPANAGTLELGAITAFELLGLGRDTGLAFGLIYHSAQVIPILIVGVLDGQRLLREPGWEQRS